MTKKEIISKINAIAKEYCGCDGIWGIKSMSLPALQEMLVRYEKMIAHERNYREAIKGTTSLERQALDLNGDSPAWYIKAWEEKMAASDIWNMGR